MDRRPVSCYFYWPSVQHRRVDLTRTIAIAGSEMKSPAYADVKVGANIGEVLGDGVKSDQTYVFLTAILSRAVRSAKLII